MFSEIKYIFNFIQNELHGLVTQIIIMNLVKQSLNWLVLKRKFKMELQLNNPQSQEEAVAIKMMTGQNADLRSQIDLTTTTNTKKIRKIWQSKNIKNKSKMIPVDLTVQEHQLRLLKSQLCILKRLIIRNVTLVKHLGLF